MTNLKTSERFSDTMVTTAFYAGAAVGVLFVALSMTTVKLARASLKVAERSSAMVAVLKGTQ